MYKNAWLTIDAQWGSTGKGLLNGYLARERQADTVVSMNGRNSGHTYVFEDGRQVVNYTLPSGFISPSVKYVLLGPESIIDPYTLIEELRKYKDLMEGKKLIIHPNATIIRDKHREIERGELNRISSTLQGVGAAQVDKIMRKPFAVASGSNQSVITDHITSRETYTGILMRSKALQIEGCQGFDLSINSGYYYPFTTSREISVHGLLSGCAIPYHIKPEIIAVARMHPIRVGHAFDKEGNKIGDSGPYYPDQRELSWEEIGVNCEKTTCTGKIRRVFTWSPKQFQKALTMLAPNSIFLNFVNYVDPCPEWDRGVAGAEIRAIEIDIINYHLKFGIPVPEQPVVKWMGTGPRHDQVKIRPEMEFL